MYSSPASARAAGVFNYTMTPPVTAQPTPGSTPGTVGSPNAGSIPVANPSTPGAIPIAKPAVPSLPGFTPGAPQFFGPGTPANRAPGLTPGTVPMSYNPLAAYTGPSPTALLQQNPNLAPTIIGGGANLGVMTDRLGNKIYAPGMPPPGFASGGLAQATAAQNEANLADEDDDGISLPNPAAPSAQTSPTGAQAMLAALPKTQVSTKSSPTSASVKRTSKAMLTDKMGQPKGMAMEMEQLSAAKTPAPEGKEPESARSQMEALAMAYKLREREALDTAKGLMKATFSRPSLERPSLLKGKLTKKRFADGGEAKKAEEVEGQDGPSASKLLRRLGLAVARGVPQAVTGLVDLAALPLTATGRMKAEDVVGTTDYLTKKGLLPKPQEGLASETAELLSSMASPGGAAKAAMLGIMGPKGIIEAARRSTAFKGRGLSAEPEKFSAKEMMDALREQGIDVERTWLRGKKDPQIDFIKPRSYEYLEALYEHQKRPDAIEQALRDSNRSMRVVGSPGSTLSRQSDDRSVTKFNTKGGVWLTDSPSIAQTYTGEKGYVIPVLTPKPDVVLNAKGEQWSDFYRKDKDWKEAFADPKVRLVEVRNIIDAGPHWNRMISQDASEEELRALLTATNLFAKKPFEQRVVSKLTGEPFPFKHGGAVSHAV